MNCALHPVKMKEAVRFQENHSSGLSHTPRVILSIAQIHLEK